MDYNKLTNLLYFKVFAMNLASVVYALKILKGVYNIR